VSPETDRQPSVPTGGAADRHSKGCGCVAQGWTSPLTSSFSQVVRTCRL